MHTWAKNTVVGGVALEQLCKFFSSGFIACQDLRIHGGATIAWNFNTSVTLYVDNDPDGSIKGTSDTYGNASSGAIGEAGQIKPS